MLGSQTPQYPYPPPQYLAVMLKLLLCSIYPHTPILSALHFTFVGGESNR